MAGTNTSQQIRDLVPWRYFYRASGERKVVRDTSLKDDAWLYHYLPWPYALVILKNRRLRLSPVQSWTDPYEKWWCRLLFEGPDRLAGVIAYGLCFSTSAFDEPAWRMYGFGKNVPIVRIGCRVGDDCHAR